MNQSTMLTRKDSLKRSMSIRLDATIIGGETLWKYALQLKLKNTIKAANKLRASSSQKDAEKIKHLDIVHILYAIQI